MTICLSETRIDDQVAHFTKNVVYHEVFRDAAADGSIADGAREIGAGIRCRRRRGSRRQGRMVELLRGSRIRQGGGQTGKVVEGATTRQEEAHPAAPAQRPSALAARVAARYRELGGTRSSAAYRRNFEDEAKADLMRTRLRRLQASGNGGAIIEYLVGLARLQLRADGSADSWLAQLENRRGYEHCICRLLGQPFQEVRIGLGTLVYDNMWPQYPNAVQVVQCGLRHWVAIRRRGYVVEIADSMDGGQTQHIEDEVKLYAQQLFGIDDLHIENACRKVRCPRQQNGYDCGLCAIACAVDWAFGVNNLMDNPFSTDSNAMRMFLQESFDGRAFRSAFRRAAGYGAGTLGAQHGIGRPGQTERAAGVAGRGGDLPSGVGAPSGLEARVAARYRQLGGTRSRAAYRRNFDEDSDVDAYALAIAAIASSGDPTAMIEYLVSLPRLQLRADGTCGFMAAQLGDRRGDEHDLCDYRSAFSGGSNWNRHVRVRLYVAAVAKRCASSAVRSRSLGSDTPARRRRADCRQQRRWIYWPCARRG